MCKRCESNQVKVVVSYSHNAQLSSIGEVIKIADVEKSRLIQSLSQTLSAGFSTAKNSLFNLLKPCLYPQSTVPIIITTNLINKE